MIGQNIFHFEAVHRHNMFLHSLRPYLTHLENNCRLWTSVRATIACFSIEPYRFSIILVLKTSSFLSGRSNYAQTAFEMLTD